MNYFSNLARVLLIAEIGVNHNGDIGLAKKLIDQAKFSGADVVKFQTFSAFRLASESTPKVGYQKNSDTFGESHFEMLKNLELSHDAHLELAEYCAAKDIDFMSTPYDVESAKFLNSLGVKLFKTASADIIDLPLQRFLASTGKPCIVATGMANLGEVERVVEIFQDENNENLILLHCVSNYPCSDKSLNLRAMNTLSNAFQLPVGFSDHSKGFLAATLAVAMGAKVVEKHFTLDRELPGPDHMASSTPEEFQELSSNIRRAETMLGNARKICQTEEREMAVVSRKSVVLASQKKAGSTLTMSDLQLKRPGTGIEPCLMPGMVGRVLRTDLPAGHLIAWSDLL